MKAIPTKYKGIQFKSKLEADWAEWFDEKKIKWFYEVEGYNINGIWYLPDFYLPDVNTIIEVKGALERLDRPLALYKYLEKIQNDQDFEEYLKLADDDLFKKAFPTREALEFYSSPHPDILFLLAGPVSHFYKLTDWDDDGFALNYCKKCGATSIITRLGDWGCRSCGDHDGDGSLHYDERLLDPLNKPSEWVD